MHAMIALAACHMQHLDIDARQYRAAEAFHCHFASQGLRKSVTSINGANDSDSILTTAFLLNTLTFCAADYREEDSFDVAGSGSLGPRWDWLSEVKFGIGTARTDMLEEYPSCLLVSTSNPT